MPCDEIDDQSVGDPMVAASADKMPAWDDDERVWTPGDIFQLLGRMPRQYQSTHSHAIEQPCPQAAACASDR